MTPVAVGRPPALLLDASIFIFRYYFALPDHWASVEGYATGAVYGYTRFLLRLLTEQQPRSIAACFDESLESCFRNQLYPAYKSSRVLPDEALAFQLNACQEVTRLLGIATFASDRYEADDLLGSLMRLLHTAEPHTPVAVLTRDKDLGQLLVRGQDFLWDYGAGGAGGQGSGQPLYREAIWQRFGVWPEQLVDYLALVGDSADDIPGVPGIGTKTAGVLLGFAGNIDALYQRLEELPSLGLRGSNKLAAKLVAQRDQVLLARRLATIVTDIDIVTDATINSGATINPDVAVNPDVAINPDVTGRAELAAIRRRPPQRAAFADFCQRMGFAGQFRLDQPVEGM